MLRQRILVNENLLYDDVLQKFGDYVEPQIINEAEIINMRTYFINHQTLLALSAEKLEEFRDINFMPVTIKVYEGNTLVNTVSKVYTNKTSPI